MLGITEYFWRLLPANPILLRVVETGGKRKRDLFIRCGYLGLLVLLVVFALVTSSTSTSGTNLSDLTKTSSKIFAEMSVLQLGLVAFLAPIFTAGAITQEKDSQTYDILLATPLTNGQIVLGSLMSRLFFIIALLISGIPIFSVTQIFGGVAINAIVLSFAIAAATAFVTGALAMAIATFKVGTRRTIFSFYLFIAIYLVGLFLLDKMDYFKVPVVDPQTHAIDHAGTSWFTGLHPFLALQAILHDKTYQPPDLSTLPENLRGWPVGWYLSNPTSFYIDFMFFLSLVLVTPSIILLRRMAQSTLSLKGMVLQKLHLSSGEKRRKPRYVWQNPIAWREAKTKASAARASILRYGFIAAGLIGAMSLVWMFSTKQDVAHEIGNYRYIDNTIFITGKDGGTFLLTNTAVTLNGNAVDDSKRTAILSGRYAVDDHGFIPASNSHGKKILTNLALLDIPRQITAQKARSFLLGACILEFAVILLIVTNAAASTVTREKEDGSLDLLLTTPITSRYYVWGKLRGLVSFVIPLIAVPIASVLMFVIYDCWRWMTTSDPSFQWIVFPEAVVILPGTLIIVAAFASILGMQMSLRCRTTVRAVMSSVGIMLGVCGGLGWCGFEFLQTKGAEGVFSLIVSSFSPFTVMTVLIDPWNFGGRTFEGSPDEIWGGRIAVFVASWIATGGYAALVWQMYKSMVKNFDMTIRKQSR